MVRAWQVCARLIYERKLNGPLVRRSNRPRYYRVIAAGERPMTQILLTFLFIAAMSMLTFAASLAEVPQSQLTAPIAVHE